MTQKYSDEAQSPQDLTESDDAKDVVRWLRQFHLRKSDAVLIATLQAVIGFGLIAALDMPWSLLGCAFVVASALVFKRMNAILAEFDRTDDVGVHFDNHRS
jgi:hypothetical protein